MENASKALLIAGGVLLAIMVVSLLILTFTKISDYQSSAQTLQKDSQLAQFNEQFTQYVRDDVSGTDLITLLNRVVDYNKKKIGAGDINYDNKITVTVNMTGFKEKHMGILYIFTENRTYSMDEVMAIVDSQRRREDTYGLQVWGALASDLDSLETFYKGTNRTAYNPGRSLKEVLGKNIPDLERRLKNNTDEVLKEIKTFAEYENFKTSTFKGQVTEWYGPGNSQVKAMKFEFQS